MRRVPVTDNVYVDPRSLERLARGASQDVTQPLSRYDEVVSDGKPQPAPVAFPVGPFVIINSPR